MSGEPILSDANERCAIKLMIETFLNRTLDYSTILSAKHTCTQVETVIQGENLIKSEANFWLGCTLFGILLNNIFTDLSGQFPKDIWEEIKTYLSLYALAVAGKHDEKVMSLVVIDNDFKRNVRIPFLLLVVKQNEQIYQNFEQGFVQQVREISQQSVKDEEIIVRLRTLEMPQLPNISDYEGTKKFVYDVFGMFKEAYNMGLIGSLADEWAMIFGDFLGAHGILKEITEDFGPTGAGGGFKRR